jgi:hypothetical protein
VCGSSCGKMGWMEIDKCLMEARGEWDSHSLLGKMVVDDCCLG